ncbi:SMP-30/gluconolactonase/LRE family protein [Pelagicoccus sp. SDUM812005]|uniref:SMP-30/gluconolactonase/LRE family protein n=1 Tax=Pelagicoccus sp. SDUM812005 TaxID=3041257 RepID=UPI00280E75F6|nr:SMP-30/gluconolactonase/LRE family protein [Pelagicoccus sp. SDUM812005]MDQ8181356.1 SMP-30/gluconolactonase/LRE family protein [Pelagicoccus sp. SDUM812005]
MSPMPAIRPFCSLALALGTLVSAEPIQSFTAPFQAQGHIERYSPELDELIAPDAQLEILATGFRWSEGPVWDSKRSRLLFTDVPENTAYRWTEAEGVSIFLQPSGHAEMKPEGIASPGANGLAFSPEGQLVLCQHGNQQIALLDEAEQTFIPLVDRFGERRFYSPNDLVYSASGALFFTDPPYGLPRERQRAIDTHYVYRLDRDGSVHQLIDSIPYPNGIGLSPDGDTLYIASSDGRSPAVHAFPLDSQGNPTGSPSLLFDATVYRSDTRKGGCDGMAIDERGTIWTTGPGGVYIIKPDGELIGYLHTDGRLANCAFGGPQGTTLYITAADKLLRIETRVRGLQH